MRHGLLAASILGLGIFAATPAAAQSMPTPISPTFHTDTLITDELPRNERARGNETTRSCKLESIDELLPYEAAFKRRVRADGKAAAEKWLREQVCKARAQR